jgi:hypothetical protein
MRTIEIIENIEYGPKDTIYYKTDHRFPTMTDVNIISDELIIAIHRVGRKVYLIKLNENEHTPTYEILDTLLLNYQTEMLTRKNNRLYIITFGKQLIIVDIIDNVKLKFIKQINLSNNNNSYHGLEIYRNNLYIVPSIVKNEPLHIIKVSLNNNEYKINKIITPYLIKNTGKYRIKDISFINDNKILLIIMINNGKTLMKDNGHCDNGFIGLYNYNINQDDPSKSNSELLDKYDFGESHLDSLIINKLNNNNIFYITVQENEGGFIYKGSINVDQNKIENITKIKCDGFPHGIDINNDYNLIGFTSYATSSVYISKLDELWLNEV